MSFADIIDMFVGQSERNIHELFEIARRNAPCVLFLDEAPEFARDVLDALRQPLEAGEVVVARSGITTRFPARFTLVLAANPCPCARVAGPSEGCSCSPATRRRYLGRISGPLLDRVDVKIELEPVSRGLYGGTVGYFGAGGDMDHAITIRTLVFRGDEYSYQAGAGVVADSVPQTEYEEVLAKSAAMARALELAQEGL